MTKDEFFGYCVGTIGHHHRRDPVPPEEVLVMFQHTSKPEAQRKSPGHPAMPGLLF
jgi:hypothetical protein